ncbi:MAG TPA: nitronate monooxygenase [Vicinamibacterales bacterium]|nr:nitronate monooxygenase [Vicinamibacterales bacterium]
MSITSLFGIELPIIQAPMAGAQGSALAIAVSNAGGLGSLGCAVLPPEAIRQELAAIAAATRKPYNVNFFCHAHVTSDPREDAWRRRLAPYYTELGLDPNAVAPGPQRLPFNDEVANLIEEFTPPIVSFHFGLPSPELVRRIKSWGSKVISSATTVAEARHLEEHGADAVIAQGFEAGGHRGMFLTHDLNTQLGTLALVRQVRAAVKVPVIAAGGIADASGVAAARALGADGVQVGTAFLFTPEATISPLHRAALKSEAAAVTAVTNVFTGRPARAIVNRIVREVGPMSAEAPPFPLAATAVMALRAKAESTGNTDFTSLWSGQSARLCREMPAADLTRQLARR